MQFGFKLPLCVTKQHDFGKVTWGFLFQIPITHFCRYSLTPVSAVLFLCSSDDNVLLLYGREVRLDNNFKTTIQEMLTKNNSKLEQKKEMDCETVGIAILFYQLWENC